MSDTLAWLSEIRALVFDMDGVLYRGPELLPGAGEFVRQLRDLPWQIRDFTPQRYADSLNRLDSFIRLHGGFTVTAHRFLVEAVRP